MSAQTLSKGGLRQTALLVFGLLLFLAVAGACYQAIAIGIDADRFLERRRLVDVGGFRLILNCTGKGPVTVVLEAGLGDFMGEWSKVQPEVAKFTRVCSYDRAGYGGSDPGPMPRTSSRVSEELHRLLQSSGEAGPYLLVGHSFGGYNVRVFAGKYPDEVAGLLLVDATQEDQYDLLPKEWNTIRVAMTERWQRQARWSSLYIDLGIPRVLLLLQGIRPSPLVLQSKYLKARASELEQIEVSAEQARAAGPFGDKPLLVLTAGKNTDPSLSAGLSAADFEQYQGTWVNDLQIRLVRLSSRGKGVVVPGSGHDIPQEQPGAVLDAVRELCDAIRESSPR
jgi:pimeloyl-ACP methyl ester carboxylesterase